MAKSRTSFGASSSALRVRLAVRRPASGEQYRSEHEECRDSIHGRSSPIGCGGVIPGASTPARIANAMFSRVGTRGCRTTINPATMPKATCDAMNHSQSMWLSSRGFSKESIE